MQVLAKITDLQLLRTKEKQAMEVNKLFMLILNKTQKDLMELSQALVAIL